MGHKKLPYKYCLLKDLRREFKTEDLKSLIFAKISSACGQISATREDHCFFSEGQKMSKSITFCTINSHKRNLKCTFIYLLQQQNNCRKENTLFSVQQTREISVF